MTEDLDGARLLRWSDKPGSLEALANENNGDGGRNDAPTGGDDERGGALSYDAYDAYEIEQVRRGGGGGGPRRRGGGPRRATVVAPSRTTSTATARF